MTSPGQKRGSCGHVMALFDSHLECARCRDKGIGDDPCVKKKQCQIYDNLSEQQKLQLATPTYRVRKELQKKSSSPSHSLTLLSYRRLRARVTLVIEAKLPVKRPKSPRTSPLPRRNPAKRLLISSLT